MKSFSELRRGTGQVDEGLVRSGAIVSYASKSRTEGQRSEQAFKRGIAELSTRKPTDSVEMRLARIENALEELLRGLTHQRRQIGSANAVDVAGHLLATKALARVERLRKVR